MKSNFLVFLNKYENGRIHTYTHRDEDRDTEMILSYKEFEIAQDFSFECTLRAMWFCINHCDYSYF